MAHTDDQYELFLKIQDLVTTIVSFFAKKTAEGSLINLEVEETLLFNGEGKDLTKTVPGMSFRDCYGLSSKTYKSGDGIILRIMSNSTNDHTRIYLLTPWGEVNIGKIQGQPLAIFAKDEDMNFVLNVDAFDSCHVNRMKNGSFVVVDVFGKVAYANEKFAIITNTKPEEVVGSDFAEYFISPESARSLYRKVFCSNEVVDSFTIPYNSCYCGIPLLTDKAVCKYERVRMNSVVKIAEELVDFVDKDNSSNWLSEKKSPEPGRVKDFYIMPSSRCFINDASDDELCEQWREMAEKFKKEKSQGYLG